MARHPGADGGPKGWQDQPWHSNCGLQAPGSVSDRLPNCRATGGKSEAVDSLTGWERRPPALVPAAVQNAGSSLRGPGCGNVLRTPAFSLKEPRGHTSCYKTQSSPAKAGRRPPWHQQGQNACRARRSLCAITNISPAAESGRITSTKFCKVGPVATASFRTVVVRSPASTCRETSAIPVGWMAAARSNLSSR